MIFSMDIEYKSVLERLRIISVSSNDDFKEIYDEYSILALQIGKVDSIESIIARFKYISEGYSVE